MDKYRNIIGQKEEIITETRFVEQFFQIEVYC